MNRLIRVIGDKAKAAGYEDIFEKHVNLTSAYDDYKFLLQDGVFEKLVKKFGQKRVTEYQQIVCSTRMDERAAKLPAEKEIDCSTCICLDCGQIECIMSGCSGCPCDCPDPLQTISKCWRDNCEHFEME